SSAGAAGGCARARRNGKMALREEWLEAGATPRAIPTPSGPFLSKGANELLRRRGHDTEQGLGRHAIEKQGPGGRRACRPRGRPGFRAPLWRTLRPDLQSGTSDDDERIGHGYHPGHFPESLGEARE